MKTGVLVQGCDLNAEKPGIAKEDLMVVGNDHGEVLGRRFDAPLLLVGALSPGFRAYPGTEPFDFTFA